MQLLGMRQEVEAHGFSDTAYATRINRFLNEAYLRVVRRVQYFQDEATSDFSTVAGTATYPQPADFGKDRSLRYNDGTHIGELQSVGLRTIDRSTPSSGVPRAYAIDGVSLHLYPTPDNVYALELRYWKIPALLVVDTDSPTIPDDYCDMLIFHAISRCFASEDDLQTAAQWEQSYNTRLSEFSADVKFPNNDAPTQIADMWAGPPTIGTRGWVDTGY